MCLTQALGFQCQTSVPCPKTFSTYFAQTGTTFALETFGLINRQTLAITLAGSPIYMAPEMLQQDGKQTHQADVWSPFVTMLWTLDTKGFRHALDSLESIRQGRCEVLSRVSGLDVIQEMAREDPDKRASAAQMLVKCFHGEGLATARSSIPPLVSCSVIIDKGAPLTLPLSKSRRVPTNAQPSALRVKKAS